MQLAVPVVPDRRGLYQLFLRLLLAPVAIGATILSLASNIALSFLGRSRASGCWAFCISLFPDRNASNVEIYQA